MTRLCLRLLFGSILLCSMSLPASAWHIIGGELYYDHVSGNTYNITLKLYRDCYSTGAQYDDPLFLGFYDASGNPVNVTYDGVTNTNVAIPFPGSVHLPVIITNPCLVTPPNVCVEQAIYTATVTFPSIPAGGIQVVYQRCCRNSTILNISDPANEGATYITTINPAIANNENSSPRFTYFPPIGICANEPLVFDHSATDPDGDSLVYSLCTPYQGADAINPQPMPAGPPPYPSVQYVSPYNVNDQLGGTPPMHIDPNTGTLYANPNTIGQFVVGVCVKEYRNGQLIGETRRDFQFNVVNCTPTVIAKFKATTETSPLPADTIIVCGSLKIDFINESVGEQTRHWDFGDPTTTADTSSQQNPSYTYPDTGTYKVTLMVNPGTLCGDTAYKIIKLHYGLHAHIKGGDLTACTNYPLQFNDSSVALDGTVDQWLWNFGDGGISTLQNPTHVYTNTGTYTVTLESKTNLGCTDNSSINVVINPTPAVLAGPDTLVCDIDSVRLFSSSGIAYAWSPNYELSATNVQNPMAQPNVTTTYTVLVTNQFNCIGRDSVVISIVDTVIARAWPDTTICAGQLVHLMDTGGVYYHWVPPQAYKHYIVSPIVAPTVNTTYYVYSYIGSCFDFDSVQVNVLPLPDIQVVEAQTINQGDTAYLHATGSDNYSWTPTNTLSNPLIADPLAFPLNTTTYVVTSVGSNGCTARDSTVVYVTHDHYLYVPNAFSPNGDGINDYFLFYTHGIRHILNVEIYNRWGLKIYDGTGLDHPWDGTYKGRAQELGVYVYLIRAETYDGDVIQRSGNLTLMR